APGSSGAPQLGVEHTALLQAAHGGQPVVARPLPIALGQVGVTVCGVQLLDAGTQRPFGPIAGEVAGDLAEVDAVVAAVGRSAGSEGDLAVRHHVAHQLGDLPDPVVLAHPADVERLVVDRFDRGVEARLEGGDDVTDVHQRTPRRAV